MGQIYAYARPVRNAWGNNYHTYLVHVADDGSAAAISASPTFGLGIFLKLNTGVYDVGHTDYPLPGEKPPVLLDSYSGADSAQRWQSILNRFTSIVTDNNHYWLKAQNSNSAAAAAWSAADLPFLNQNELEQRNSIELPGLKGAVAGYLGSTLAAHIAMPHYAEGATGQQIGGTSRPGLAGGLRTAPRIPTRTGASLFGWARRQAAWQRPHPKFGTASFNLGALAYRRMVA